MLQTASTNFNSPTVVRDANGDHSPPRSGAFFDEVLTFVQQYQRTYNMRIAAYVYAYKYSSSSEGIL